MLHAKDMCPFIFTPIGDAFLQDQEIPIKVLFHRRVSHSTGVDAFPPSFKNF